MRIRVLINLLHNVSTKARFWLSLVTITHELLDCVELGQRLLEHALLLLEQGAVGRVELLEGLHVADVAGRRHHHVPLAFTRKAQGTGVVPMEGGI